MRKRVLFCLLAFLSYCHFANAISLNDLKNGFQLTYDESAYHSHSLKQEIRTPSGKIGIIRRPYHNITEWQYQNKPIEYFLYDKEENLIAKAVMRSYTVDYIDYCDMEVYDESNHLLGKIRKELALISQNFEICPFDIILNSNEEIKCRWHLFSKYYSLTFSEAHLLDIDILSTPEANGRMVDFDALEACGMDPRVLLLATTCMTESNYISRVLTFTRLSCPDTGQEMIPSDQSLSLIDIKNGFFLFSIAEVDWNISFDVYAAGNKVGRISRNYYKADITNVPEYIFSDDNGHLLAKATIRATDVGVNFEVTNAFGQSLGIIKENFADSPYLFKRNFAIISPSQTEFTAHWNVWEGYYTIWQKDSSYKPFANLSLPRIINWIGMEVTDFSEMQQYDLDPLLLILANACQCDEKYARMMWKKILKNRGANTLEDLVNKALKPN